MPRQCLPVLKSIELFVTCGMSFWYPLRCTLGKASRFARCLALCLPVLAYPVLNLGFWLPRSVKLIFAFGNFFGYPLPYLMDAKLVCSHDMLDNRDSCIC